MLSKIAAAATVALASANEHHHNKHWLKDKLHDLLSGQKLEESATQILEGLHQVDSGLKEMHKGLKEKLHDSIEKGIKKHELSRDPDFSKTFSEIVAENGFIFEQHPVTT